LLGTADWPVAWDLPCPYSFVDDILIVFLKTGVTRTMGRVKVRSLSAAEDMMDELMDFIDNYEAELFMYGAKGVSASLSCIVYTVITALREGIPELLWRRIIPASQMAVWGRRDAGVVQADVSPQSCGHWISRGSWRRAPREDHGRKASH
jgi:hypothetical protein